MAIPVAVIIRFSGDPDDLLERFERARQTWIDVVTFDSVEMDEGRRPAVPHRRDRNRLKPAPHRAGNGLLSGSASHHPGGA
jgi:hypothetical protein